MRALLRPALVLGALLASVPALAEVVEKSPGGFSVRTSFVVPGTPEAAYQAVVRLPEWWEKDHTYSGDSKNLSLAPVPGGCWCEALPGGGVQHGTVALAWPGRTLRVIGGLGPLQALGVSGAMTWQFEKAAEGTTVTFTYVVGGHAAGGLEALAPLVDGVLMAQMKAFQAYAAKR